MAATKNPVDVRTRIAADRVCTMVRRSTGERCKNPAMTGINHCYTHTLRRPRELAKSERAKLANAADEKMASAMTRFERLVQLIPEDDPEARGDVALLSEIRRTVQRIRVFDEWIAELKDDALIWGKTEVLEHEGDGSSTSPSFNEKRYATRVNVYYELQSKERVHLANLSKIWISAGFKQRELDQAAAVAERDAAAFHAALLTLLGLLGLDPSDPGVHAAVHQAMLGLKQPAALESGT